MSQQHPYQQYGAKSYHPFSSGKELPVPYIHNLPNGMPPSAMVTIVGEIPHRADKFAINILTRSGEHLLHLNPRFGADKVIRNSHLQGGWGPEETDGGMPLHRGQPFGCILLARDDRFLIAFNGQHFTDYQFRAPCNAHQIRIEGDVKLSKVDVAVNPMMPMPIPQGVPAPYIGQGFPPPERSAPPINQSYAPPGLSGENAIFTPPVPFKAKVAGGMMPGRTVTFSMVPKRHSPERIRIDLQKDMDGTEIALHMDIRFDVGGHHRIICLNNYKFGHWGEEQRYHHFPFQAGVGCDLVIKSDPTGYIMFANGEQLGFFQHRDLDLTAINVLHIQGDLKITRIAF